MYSIERAENTVIVRDGNTRAIFVAPPDSFIVYKGANSSNVVEISKVKDLSDEKLLLALVNAVEIKDFVRR